jgi:hypothetical protein
MRNWLFCSSVRGCWPFDNELSRKATSTSRIQSERGKTRDCCAIWNTRMSWPTKRELDDRIWFSCETVSLSIRFYTKDSVAVYPRNCHTCEKSCKQENSKNYRRKFSRRNRFCLNFTAEVFSHSFTVLILPDLKPNVFKLYLNIVYIYSNIFKIKNYVSLCSFFILHAFVLTMKGIEVKNLFLKNALIKILTNPKRQWKFFVRDERVFPQADNPR